MMRKIMSLLPTGAQDLILVLGMVGVLMILFIPISTGLLDFLLLTNFSAALLILLITFYTEKPLEFSTFPSLLLMTTLFRLSLNVSTTRLILQNGDAGSVIDAVGTHVVAGNYIIGLIIFFILIVVQYVVVTNGAQRVAEVAARFTLDSLPGKQMSVDADLNMGIIDTHEAKSRRSLLERESNFYGAMDGASKFVKGDAIAGIIIIFINIIGGLCIGIFQLKMSWSDALHKYTLLTVGDGIVTQIPSLIIAVASGIIITRAATDARLGVEVVKQFTAHPKTILIILIALIAQAFIPGIPFFPVLILMLLFGGVYWYVFRRNLSKTISELSEKSDLLAEDASYAEMITSAFETKLGHQLHALFIDAESEVERRTSILRKNLANDLGFILPTLTFKKDSKLKAAEYKIFIQGESVALGSLTVGKILAISPKGDVADIEGEGTREPTYGLPAKWIDPQLRELAVSLGYTLIEPDTVFLTHLQETIKRNAGNFITRAEVEKLLNSRKSELGNVIEELIPGLLTYSDIQRVFQNLLNEQVSVKNVPVIMDVVADVARSTKDPDEISERCREKLRSSICDSLSDSDGRIYVITIYPSLERKLMSTFLQKESAQIGLSPKEMDVFISKLIRESERLIKSNVSPVILCAAPLRRHLRKMLKRSLPLIKILSINELDEKVNVVSSGIVNIENVND